MIQFLKNEILRNGDKAAIIPVQRLQEVRQDIEDLKGKVDLNNFQRYITTDLYSFNMPETDFEVQSIIIVATPCPAVIQLKFAWNGKSIPAVVPGSYTKKDSLPGRVGSYLEAFLQPWGCHILYAPRLPFKRIAVRSGLAEYGRNNICYVDGMGSFLNLALYFSDMPCPEDEWQEVRQMEICDTCRACLNNCPTAAIKPNRFLINNERCLTYFNEAGREYSFPDWIDPRSHHTLYDCMRCQTVCPVDQEFMKSTPQTIEFSEEETGFLVEGKPFDLFPASLKEKVETYEMREYLGAMPRNLRALINNAA